MAKEYTVQVSFRDLERGDRFSYGTVMYTEEIPSRTFRSEEPWLRVWVDLGRPSDYIEMEMGRSFDIEPNRFNHWSGATRKITV